jgi:dsDNA-binding SOS-regulon protein
MRIVLYLFLFLCYWHRRRLRKEPPMTNAKPCKPAAHYRTDAPRADGWTYQRQATFLMTLAHSGLVSQACKAAEMSVASAYALRCEPRGAAFALGWHAAHLMARDRLADVLLEAAIAGVESLSTRVDGVTHRRVLNGNLSMAVLNRLDRRAAALDDQAAAVARSIGAAFEDFIGLVLDGGGAEAIAAFLADNRDPLGDAHATHSAPAPQLVEKSAIFTASPKHNRPPFDPIAAPSPRQIPCACPADRNLALLEAV